MEVGYIKLHRSILDWEWYDDIYTKTVFIHLLLNANYTPHKWHGHDVMPGQLVASAETIAKACGMTRQNVRTALIKLEKTESIIRVAIDRFSLITLCNWQAYQIGEDDVSHTNVFSNSSEKSTNQSTNPQSLETPDSVGVQGSRRKRSTNQSTTNQPRANHELTTLKEGNKERREETLFAYGELGNVAMRPEQYEQLVQTYGLRTTEEYVGKVDLWIENNPQIKKKRSNLYATVLGFMRKDDVKKKPAPVQPKRTEREATPLEIEMAKERLARIANTDGLFKPVEGIGGLLRP